MDSLIKTVSLSIITIFLTLPITATYAERGCCSQHGGVVGCDKRTGHDLCKDGTSSPTCLCNGSVVKETKETKEIKKTTYVPPVPKTTTTKTTTTQSTPATTTGCCSGHGGVLKCNTKTGHQICKDGTESPTCMCKIKKTKAKATKKDTSKAKAAKKTKSKSSKSKSKSKSTKSKTT